MCGCKDSENEDDPDTAFSDNGEETAEGEEDEDDAVIDDVVPTN